MYTEHTLLSSASNPGLCWSCFAVADRNMTPGRGGHSTPGRGGGGGGGGHSTPGRGGHSTPGRGGRGGHSSLGVIPPSDNGSEAPS